MVTYHNRWDIPTSMDKPLPRTSVGVPNAVVELQVLQENWYSIKDDGYWHYLTGQVNNNIFLFLRCTYPNMLWARGKNIDEANKNPKNTTYRNQRSTLRYTMKSVQTTMYLAKDLPQL